MAMTEREIRRLMQQADGGSDEPLSPDEVRQAYARASGRPGSGTSPLERIPGAFSRGIQDVVEGIEQLRLQVGGPSIEEVRERGGVTTPAREFTADINREREEFRESGRNEPVSRMIGQTAALAPLALIPGGQGTLLARLASGAAAGGAAGGAMFAPSGTMKERAFNAAVGAVGGAAVPEAVRAGAGKASAFGLNRRGPTPEALARRADFDELGIRPTTGQVTRNPQALAAERNVGQIPGVGDEVRAVRAGQAPRLTQALDEAVPGESVTQTEAGRRIMGTLGTRFDDGGIYRQMGNKIDDLFDRARSAAGVDDVLDADSFTSRISDTLDNFEDVIPQPVRRRISQLGDDRTFTVGEAFKLRQLLNARARNTNDAATGAAMGAIKRELDDFLMQAGESGTGEEALNLFRQANAASRRRARAFSGDLRKVVDDKVAPDDFVRRHVIGGNVDDIRQMRATLVRKGGEKGEQAWNTARRQVVDHLMDKAVSDTGNFSPSRYNNALSRIGDDKLQVLFDGDELGQLRRIGRAATNLLSDPPSGGIPVGNRSGTAAGVFEGMPVIGDWAQRFMRGGAANRALAGSPVDRIGNQARGSQIADIMTNPAGTNPFAAPGGLLGMLVSRRAAGERR